MSFIHLTSRRLAEYTPPSLRKAEQLDELGIAKAKQLDELGFVVAPVFQIRIPTPMEQEQVAARMIALGLQPVGEQQIRATMIDALWDIHSEEEAERVANLLDGVWQRQRVQEAAMTHWQEQESQRLLDEMEGAPARPPYPMPSRMISIREEAQAAIQVNELTNRSDRVRDLIAQRMDFARRNSTMLIRMNVASVTSLPGCEQLESVEGVLTEDAASSIKNALARVPRAWVELTDHVDRLYVLDGVEEKNSDSPPGKPSDQIGSDERSGELAPNGGSSTISSISPAPTAELEPTTGPSSSSISAPDERTSSDFPTGGV